MSGMRCFVVLAAAAAAIGLGYLGFRVYRGSQAEQCYACQRAIHAQSRTVTVDKEHVRAFCCLPAPFPNTNRKGSRSGS